MKNFEKKVIIIETYRMLWNIIAMYDETDCYNKYPNNKVNNNIKDYLKLQFKNIRKNIMSLTLGLVDLRQRLLNIVDETESFVRKYERPGVVNRWKKINPKIMFFSCAFDIKENHNDFYKEICRGLVPIKLDCYPDEEFCEERSKYFKSIIDDRNSKNIEWNENKLFENELLNTLTLLFEFDFAKELSN